MTPDSLNSIDALPHLTRARNVIVRDKLGGTNWSI